MKIINNYRTNYSPTTNPKVTNFAYMFVKSTILIHIEKHIYILKYEPNTEIRIPMFITQLFVPNRNYFLSTTYSESPTRTND